MTVVTLRFPRLADATYSSQGPISRPGRVALGPRDQDWCQPCWGVLTVRICHPSEYYLSPVHLGRWRDARMAARSTIVIPATITPTIQRPQAIITNRPKMVSSDHF